MMQKFIQTAQNLQTTANTTQEAVKCFAMSCNICCKRGIKMDCDRCPVKVSHELVVAVFADLEEYDRNKNS
jgi:hypothetical protein